MNILRGLTIAALLATSAPVVATAETDVIYNSYLPPFNETFQIGIRDFTAAINEVAGGDLTVTIPDSSMAPGNRQYEMVRDGIADMAIISTSSVPQLVALTLLGEMPGFAPTAESGSVALWETYNEYFKDVGEYEGVRVLSMHVLPGRDLLSVNEELEINSPSDLAGQRLWATVDAFVALAESAGAIPMDTEYPELQEFVARGDLDGLFISPGSADGAGVLENTSQIARLPGGFGSVSFAIVISEDKWNELTEAQQGYIMTAATDLPRRLGSANDAGEIEAADKVAEIGVTELSGEGLAAFQELLAPQINGWIEAAKEAGLEDPQAAIDFYMSVLERETSM